MARKAVLRFVPIEYLYQETFGIMPDYHVDLLIKQGKTPDEANAYVLGQMQDLWHVMKEDHEHELELIHQELAKECPF